MNRIFRIAVLLLLGLVGSGGWVSHAQYKETDLAEAGKGWYLKTNLSTYFLLVPNLAIEWEMGKHFSGSVPIYHCGWDWFRLFNKFRVLGIQPEVRYYLKDNFSGFFGGVHATMAWYNIAMGGDYRYQDQWQDLHFGH